MNKSYGIAAVMMCVLLVGGCRDFLMVDPVDELSREEALTTLRGTRAAVLGAYSRLSQSDYYQTLMTLYPEMQGNLKPSDRNLAEEASANTLQATYRQPYAFIVESDYENSNVDELYQGIYQVLFQVNDILTALPALAEGTDAERRSMEGELLAMRGLAHFDLCRLYAQSPAYTAQASHPGVVIVTRPLGLFEQPSRSPVQQVYQQVIADWERAAQLIDATLVQRTSDPVWFTPAVVHGLLARAHAYQRSWEAVVTSATTAIATSTRSLTPTEAYLTGWATGQLGEVLLEIDLQQFVNEEVGNASALTGISRVVGFGVEDPVLQVSDDLLAYYTADDLRRQLYQADSSGQVLSKKYPFTFNALPNAPVLRLSELYLLRAEALAELGRTAEAQADYNRIHQRAVTTAPATTLVGDELLAEIRRERRRELALEGHLLYDLSRWGLAVDRSDCPPWVLRCDLPYPHPRYVLPIPQEALLRNPALQQNEGY